MPELITEYDYARLDQDPFYDPFAEVVNDYLNKEQYLDYPLDFERLDPDYWLHRHQESEEERRITQANAN